MIYFLVAAGAPVGERAALLGWQGTGEITAALRLTLPTR